MECAHLGILAAGVGVGKEDVGDNNVDYSLRLDEFIFALAREWVAGLALAGIDELSMEVTLGQVYHARSGWDRRSCGWNRKAWP